MDNEFEQVNPDAPEFTKEIVKKPYNSSTTIPLDINFTPYNHFTAKVPVTSTGLYEEPDFSAPPKEEPSFLDTAVSQAKHINDTWHYLHAGFTQLQKPWNDPIDPNFNPMAFQDKFINIEPEYYKYLLDSQNEADMNFRLNRITSEQKNKENIKNGSWMAYLTGGAVGIATDLTNLIPIVGQMKYAKYGKTFLTSMARALPGAATYGVVSSLGEQLDKISGNAQDWLIDSMTRTAFVTTLFGGFGVVSLAADKSALWKLKDFASDYMKGIDYKLKVDKNNKVVGFEAYDMTGDSVGAARVKLAQDKADSTFLKAGIFKIPYVGEAATRFLGNRYFGSSIVSMLNSPYETVRAVADLSVDHGIITEGIEKGIASPKKFFTLMKQTHASIRAQEAQINGLHLERNGFDLDNYVAQGATKAALYTKEKALEFLGKNLGNKPYVNREEFFSEIEDVLINESTSPHGSVNEAAALLREVMDDSYKQWRTAYNLPEDWMPPRTARGYLMRVYDTNFLNNNEGKWVQVISDYLKQSDETIIKHTKPINDITRQIENHILEHDALISRPNITDNQVKNSAEKLQTLKIKKKVLEETLQNSIRTNPELHLLAEEWNDLSAEEAKELIQLTKRRDVAQKFVDEQKQLIRNIKTEASKRNKATQKSKTVKTAKSGKQKAAIGELVAEREEIKLAELEKDLKEETIRLQEMAESGQINRRFFSKPQGSFSYVFKDPSQRLKLRKTYHEQKGYLASEEDAHLFREQHAKAYYDTIMNQTAEDTINQVMGKFTGNGAENHLMSRTLMIPDEVLYKHKFMTKDLLAKTANYQSWLARRTHLKNVYNNLTLEGGFEPIIAGLKEEYDFNRALLNGAKEKIENQLLTENLSVKTKKELNKKLTKSDIELNKEKKRFEKAKTALNFTYEKMAGISKLSKNQKAFQSSVRSFTVLANLGFLPLTMITDLSANGLKHGVLPFLRDGIYPMVQSLGGMLKTKDSEALRNAAAAANLALQHIGGATSEKNIGLQTNPYLNMGKIPSALDKTAHLSANFNLTNFFDNTLQRITSAVAQSEIMRMMVAHQKGTLSVRDKRWLLRYGLDPKEWSEKMISQFKSHGGGKTSLGGYQSNYWQWLDWETSNTFSDAVFRATHDTVISANTLDTPFWMDSNGPMGIMGPIFKGFNGWAFGSLNRYVIPFMQKPDALQFMGVLSLLATGALVSPMRRIARGEEAYPPDQTDEQWAYEVISDSGFFSYFMTILNDANVLTKDGLLGDLKNDKYRNRSRAGLLGPAIGDANSMADFFTALASNEMNEVDALKMARMVPFANAPWTYWMSKQIIENFGLPKTRSIAHRQKDS